MLNPMMDTMTTGVSKLWHLCTDTVGGACAVGTTLDGSYCILDEMNPEHTSTTGRFELWQCEEKDSPTSLLGVFGRVAIAQAAVPMPFVIVACGAKKRTEACRADEMYLGELHRSALRYARSLTSDRYIRILSARHGLLPLDEVIDPYEQRVKTPGAVFSFEVALQLVEWNQEQGLTGRPCIALCGRDYLDAYLNCCVVPAYVNFFATPLQGLGIGQQIQWLKNACSAAADRELVTA